MRLFLYFILVAFSVQMSICETGEGSYSVSRMPDPLPVEDTKPKHEFKVYWNVPTMQCQSKKIPFEKLFERYGIIQNKNDDFRGGDKITILYEPGKVPNLKQVDTGKMEWYNGGVPQKGNLQIHLDALKADIDRLIPNKDYNGLAIIDYEHWKPIFRQNFGKQIKYKVASYALEERAHSEWTEKKIAEATKERFERAGRIFMESSIFLAKHLRPNATWGYYAYPYCYNTGRDCSPEVYKESDKMEWLWAQSMALFPSFYSSSTLSPQDLSATVRWGIAEAKRVRQNNAPILPYVSYKYRDGGFFKQEHLDILLDTIYNSSASGLIIWGSSNDVSTVEDCKTLLHYITNVFGPTIAQYTDGEKPYLERPVEIENDLFETESDLEQEMFSYS